MPAPDDVVRYRRNHFSARLPVACKYSLSHFWLRELVAKDGAGSGTWRVGLTGFATRMLGEIVEFDFEVDLGDTVSVGQTIGWIEGFKAVSDVISVLDGDFDSANPAATADPAVICRKPFAEGWLYQVTGTPDAAIVDVDGYIAHLDRTIDKMLEKPWQSATDASAEAERNEPS